MELRETIKLMESEDFKERFQAEYLQTKIRYDKLRKMLIKLAAGTLDFKPKCPISVLEIQADYIENYLKILEIRAEIENINLQEQTIKTRVIGPEIPSKK